MGLELLYWMRCGMRKLHAHQFITSHDICCNRQCKRTIPAKATQASTSGADKQRESNLSCKSLT